MGGRSSGALLLGFSAGRNWRNQGESQGSDKKQFVLFIVMRTGGGWTVRGAGVDAETVRRVGRAARRAGPSARVRRGASPGRGFRSAPAGMCVGQGEEGAGGRLRREGGAVARAVRSCGGGTRVEEARGRTEKVCGREGTRGEVRGGFEWASRGSKPGSGGGRSSANQRRQAAVEAL